MLMMLGLGWQDAPDAGTASLEVRGLAADDAVWGDRARG